jgi:dihydrofolate synthase/folylpolyglutamate synthase
VVDRRTVIFGALADKDLRGILRALAPATGRLIVTSNASPRSASAEQLRKEADAVGLVAETAESVAVALQRALADAGEAEAVVVTGSLYTVVEARELLVGPGPAA